MLERLTKGTRSETRRENGAEGPVLVRRPAGWRLSQSGPPQVTEVSPDQM